MFEPGTKLRYKDDYNITIEVTDLPELDGKVVVIHNVYNNSPRYEVFTPDFIQTKYEPIPPYPVGFWNQELDPEGYHHLTLSQAKVQKGFKLERVLEIKEDGTCVWHEIASYS